MEVGLHIHPKTLRSNWGQVEVKEGVKDKDKDKDKDIDMEKDIDMDIDEDFFP